MRGWWIFFIKVTFILVIILRLEALSLEEHFSRIRFQILEVTDGSADHLNF